MHLLSYSRFTCCLSLSAKSNEKDCHPLLDSLTNNLGNPDTSSWKNYLIYKWEQVDKADNSINIFYFSYRFENDSQLYIQFSKYNSRLSEKAIKANKHVGHI